MEKFANGLNALITQWQPFIWIAVAAALVVIGLMFIIPSQKSKIISESSPLDADLCWLQ